jgi:hypothetical protein
MYLLTATKGERVVKLERPDVPTAYTSARRLRALGWETKVEPLAIQNKAARGSV